MANNAIGNIFRIKELRNKILFTLAMLLIFRLGSVIPVPGIDVNALESYYMDQIASGANMGLTEYLDFFSGGAFKNFSIFMLGIMPYISMSIIMQLMMLIFPFLKRISEEDGGRKKIQKYIRYGTVVVCLIQSFTLLQSTKGMIAANFQVVVPELVGWQFSAIAVLTVTVGTLFLMWMGEQINEKGIGNGISLIIFTGIVARMPTGVNALVREVRNGSLNFVFVIFAIAIFVAVIVLVIYEQQGQRKIPVNYAKRIVGRKVYGAQSTYIPLKINPSGVIPVIFASAILTVPLQIGQQLGVTSKFWMNLSSFFAPGGLTHSIVYVILIIAFAYFYTQVSLNPIEIARQIRENGGSVPGVRSENLEQYLTRVLNRIVLPGSIFLAFIALIPTVINNLFNFPLEAAYLMGGTSLLILVGVDLDTMSQIESHLKMHHHDGLVKSGKLKSRNL